MRFLTTLLLSAATCSAAVLAAPLTITCDAAWVANGGCQAGEEGKTFELFILSYSTEAVTPTDENPNGLSQADRLAGSYTAIYDYQALLPCDDEAVRRGACDALDLGSEYPNPITLKQVIDTSIWDHVDRRVGTVEQDAFQEAAPKPTRLSTDRPPPP